MLACAVGHAQLIGPIPPAAPPTPRYIQPESRDAPPRVDAPETEPIAPSIIARDERGRLGPLKGTAEEAVVAAYPFDAARRAKIAASAAARTLDLDRFVIANLDKVLAARRMKGTVEREGELDKLLGIREVTAAVRFERLIDRLERDRAVTLAQRVRLDEALLAYDKARGAQIEDEAGGDPTRSAVLNLRQTFADATREPLASLDRQIDDLSENRPALAAALAQSELSPAQKAQWDAINARLRILPAGGEPSPPPLPRGWARDLFFDVLDMEQRRVFLAAGLARRARRGE
jgi:hypothetical protein